MANNFADSILSATADMTDVASLIDTGAFIYGGTTSGTGTALTATVSPAPTAYATGQRYIFKANVSNTAACTININSLGIKNIRQGASGATDLDPNMIRINEWFAISYDGTQFCLLDIRWELVQGEAHVQGSATNTASASLSALSSMSVTITTPANSVVVINAYVCVSNSTTGNYTQIGISQDSTTAGGSGRCLCTEKSGATSGFRDVMAMTEIYTPSAGSHTYRVLWLASSNTSYSDSRGMTVLCGRTS